ncbi:hypothetical protein C0Z10_10555 [Acidipropionibacterium jensenii]|uniref:DNA-binding protein n=1 Tax=Acidipropionibacterium jensenii TaxID=1749 RepID=A0A3Q9ULT6_9ACTN|nr:hypothetical protein [Acidipropionibacterium jensenii]AZZ40118.1 hypothetical protein C0Z10_10555 [Acidipropionibacterium jensenii]
MMIDVEMRVTGVALDDPQTAETLAVCFPDTAWEQTADLTTVTVFVEHDANMVSSVLEQVRRLQAALPGLRVLDVFRDYVSVTSIAHRVGLTREGVRKWTLEPGFPIPSSILGPNSLKVWPWSDIVEWVNRSRGVDLEDHIPTTREATQIDNCLMRNPDATTIQWEAVSVDHRCMPFHESTRATAMAMPNARWTPGTPGMKSMRTSATSPEVISPC